MQYNKKYTSILLLFLLIVLSSGAQSIHIKATSKPILNTCSSYNDYMQFGDYYYISNSDSARIAYEKACNLIGEEGDPYQRMECLSKLSFAYDNLGQTDTAIAIAYQAVELALKYSNDTLLAETYLRLGNYYKEIRKYDQAVTFYKKTIDLGFQNSMNGAWGALGILYSNMNKLDSARFFLEKSLNFFKSRDTSRVIILNNIASISGSIGIICFDEGKFDEGLSYFKESLRLSKKVNNPVTIVSNLLNLSIAYDMLSQSSQAEDLLRQALSITDSINNQKLHARVFLLMSDHYYEIKNYKYAYDYLDKYHALNDSLERLNYANDLHEKELSYLKHLQDAEIRSLALKKEKEQLYFILIIGASTIVFIFITVFLFRQVQKRTREKLKAEKKSGELSMSLQQAKNALADLNNRLVEQNETINKLSLKLKDPNPQDYHNAQKELDDMQILRDGDWQKYMDVFMLIYPNFINNIVTDFPNLSEGDKRQLIMLKLNYSRNKSASILGISPESVKRARQRLSKKLGLENVTQLDDFVREH